MPDRSARDMLKRFYAARIELLFACGEDLAAKEETSALVFGAELFAPRNETVVASLFVCALSVSGAIFLILEMNSPFAGIVKISSAPMREALAHLGQ